MTDQEARDEREALIDAMINVEVSGGMVEFCPADREDAGYLADAILAAGYRKHPEPKPWEEAEDGEIWVLTSGGVDLPWTRQADQWVSATPGKLLRRNVDLITAGRRIWPDAAKAVVNERTDR